MKVLFAALLFERSSLIPQVKTCLHVAPLFIRITESRESLLKKANSRVRDPAGQESFTPRI